MSDTYCPYAWNHFSTRVDGHMRLCCNGGINSGIINDNNGDPVKINEVKDLLEYFNLDHYKQIRKNMLNGIRNPECGLCYSIEDNGGTSIRDYAVKKYPYENFKDITDEDTGEISETRVNYLDLAWSNKCNLQCRMCDPNASDQLIKEFNELHYPVKDYIVNNKSFWVYENIDIALSSVSTTDLSEILVTGGEPLVNNDFYKFCEFLIEKDLAKNIHLSFHTNLTVTPKKWHNLFSKFKYVGYKVSIDAVGDAYEYIRFPGKWKVLKENIEDVIALSSPADSNTYIEFHTVFSIFNAHSIVDLLKYLASLNKFNGPAVLSIPHFNFVEAPKVACPIYYPEEEKLRIKSEIEEYLNSYDNSSLPEYVKGHNKDKISILKAVIELMFSSQPDNAAIIEVINKIKQVDQYRKQDTYKNMPWIEKFESS